MKECSLIIDIKNRQEQNFDNFANFSSYKELKIIKLININIIKSKISIFEYFQPYKYLSLHNIGLIDEINKKYQDYPESLMNNLNNIPKVPQPLFNINSENDYNFSVTNNSFSDLFNNILINHNKISYIHDLNQNINKINFISKKNHLTILNDNHKKIKISNKDLVNKRLFLEHKRKRYIYSSKKKYKKTLAKFSNEKKSKKRNENINEKQMNIIEEEFDNMNKKLIFDLTRNEKGKKRVKEISNYFFNKTKRNPGRKKKNSGEIGFHNKFSKDNMMRKLKNKAIESARKLLNKIIKSEAGKDYKFYKEIHKIEGIYNQDLNINYNIWFYFQKLKDIFQFNMSRKYSKNNLNLNQTIINRIYSEDNKDKFSKTINLLEMEFHQFYHYIFLGEKKNWYINLNIKEKDNIFQLEYFLNKIISKSDKDYLIYKRDITNLAYKYELFFLTKNPRLPKIKNKKKTEESESKKLIKHITKEQFDILKNTFVTTGMSYLSDMAYTYRNYLNNNLTNLNETFLPFLNLNSNNVTQNEENEASKLSLEITDNTNKVEQSNIINNNNNNNNINVNNNTLGNNKHVLFDVSKKLIFKTNRKTPNKNNNKKIFKLSLKKDNSEPHVLSYKFKISNTKTDGSKQKIDKETQTNNLIQEESSQNLKILI